MRWRCVDRIFLAFELAERETDQARRQALLTFVVVGGGPTGVELAGAIAEIARHTVSKDFRAFDPRDARVVLLEGGPRVLGVYGEDLSRRAQRSLERLGVEVLTDAVATDITPSEVRIGDKTIPAYTTLWAAGVAASPLGRQLGVEVDRSGRVPVQPDLTVAGHPDIYVVGDLAALYVERREDAPGHRAGRDPGRDARRAQHRARPATSDRASRFGISIGARWRR